MGFDPIVDSNVEVIISGFFQAFEYGKEMRLIELIVLGAEQMELCIGLLRDQIGDLPIQEMKSLRRIAVGTDHILPVMIVGVAAEGAEIKGRNGGNDVSHAEPQTEVDRGKAALAGTDGDNVIHGNVARAAYRPN